MISEIDTEVACLNREINRIISQKKKNLDHHADCIIPGVWAGGITAACDLSFLRNQGIDVIINLSSYQLPEHPGISMISCPLNEHVDYPDLLNQIKSAAKVVRQSGNHEQTVLICCKKGKKCCSSVIIYYLIRYFNMDLISATELVKVMRPSCISYHNKLLETLVYYQCARKLGK